MLSLLPPLDSIAEQFVEKLAHLSFRASIGEEKSRIACIFRARFLASLGMTWGKRTSTNFQPFTA